MSFPFRHPAPPFRSRRLLPGSRTAAGLGLRGLFLLAALFPAGGLVEAQEGDDPAPAGGIAVVTETEENFRAEPNGMVVARVVEGSRLAVAGGDGQWIEADLEGWVWVRSLQVLEDPDFDLVVSAEGGENLRSAPSGSVYAHLAEGTYLRELERIPGWIRVQRRGWIWRASTRIGETGTVAAPGGEAAPRGPAAAPQPEGAAATEIDGPAGGTDGDDDAEGIWRRAPADGAALLAAPDGDTLGRARPGAELRILGRRGSWARVRVEGWAWMPAEIDESVDEAVLRGVSPSSVSSDPDRFRGRIVAWELQFISLERAEEVRTDFYEGEPFLLTRATGDERPFVYVALPPERSDEVAGLVPLERIHVVGRVRTGSAAFTGSPILDLLEWRRVRATGESPGPAGS